MRMAYARRLLALYQETFVRIIPISKLAFSPLLLLSGVVAADTGDTPDTIVVSATRTPLPEREVASSISVVTADDIAMRQLRTLPDILQQVPGLNVVQTGGPGGQTSIFMRGTNSNHTKVFVDGIDVSDPSNPTGAFDFSQFLAQDIERVEVLRGPQSGLYGSDAIGGVINVITKSGSGPAKITAGIEGGSFDTFNQTVGINGAVQDFHYAANLEHLHAGETPVTPRYLLAPGERRIEDYDDNLTASSKLGYDFNDQFDLGLVARYTDTHLRITGDDFSTFPATPAAAQSENDTRQLFARLSAHAVLAEGAFEQTLGLAWSNLKLSDLNPDATRSDLAGERVKADWLGNIRLGDGEQLVLGAEHQRDEITLPVSAATRIESGYAELQSTFSDAFAGSVAARYDHNDRFGSKVTYRVAPEYSIKDSGTKFKASLGTGFKAPTLDQLFQNFPEFGFFANPNLRPETSLGWDVGIEQTALMNSLRFGATYFHNNIRNLIEDNADFSTYINVGRATTQGAESFVSYQAFKTLALRLDYTYTLAVDDDLRQELLRRPKHKVILNSTWAASERLSLSATLLGTSSWVDGNRDFSVQRLTASGYATVNIAATYDLSQHFAVFARVNNLFDHQYETPVGFLAPSRGAYAGLKAKF